MKYLNQFLIIMAFTLAGEALQRIVPLPIPASVYGLVLLFAALCLKIVKTEQVKEAGSFLTSLLPLLFISPVAGILSNWSLIRGSLLPVCALVLISTVLIFGLTGRLTQWLLKKGRTNMAELLQMEVFSLVLTLAVFRVGQLCQKKWKLPCLIPPSSACSCWWLSCW